PPSLSTRINQRWSVNNGSWTCTEVRPSLTIISRNGHIDLVVIKARRDLSVRDVNIAETVGYHSSLPAVPQTLSVTGLASLRKAGTEVSQVHTTPFSLALPRDSRRQGYETRD